MQIGILERGVTQPEPERILRLPLEIHIGPALANVVIHHRRQILQRLDPRGHQPSGRIVVAEQHIRQSIALLLARVRHVQNRRSVLLHRAHRVRKARNQHHDGLGIRPLNRLHQLRLRLLQFDRLAVHRLFPLARQASTPE